MEIVRYVNGELIYGEIPEITVENTILFQILRELQNRIALQSLESSDQFFLNN